MCGIGGALMYGANYTEVQLNYIRKLVAEIAVENQDRGTHATGFAIFNEKGEYAVAKDKQKASDFVRNISTKNFLKNNITNDTTNILIHTRFATQGSIDNNMNNHPIETATSIGVHNGMIYNDEQVFSKYGLTRQAEVDSEAIFRLVDHFGKNKNIGHDDIKEVAEAISGSFTFAFVQKNNPYRMHITKNDNPITMAYIESLQTIVFASLEDYVINAIESANEDFLNTYYVDLDKDITLFQPKKEHIYTFDVLGNPLEQFEQAPTKFKENYDGFYYSSTWGYNDYGWYDDEESAKPKSAYDIIDGLSTKLSSEEYLDLMNALEDLETNSWADGFKRGRESTEEETKAKVEKAFSDGYSLKVNKSSKAN